MKLNLTLKLTRERAKVQVIDNLVRANVLSRNETARYGKVLDTYDNLTLARVLIISHELMEAGEEK